MKKTPVVALQLLLYSLLFVQCNRQPEIIAQLPELPASQADELRQSKTAPVLMTAWDETALDTSIIADRVTAAAPEKSCIRKYWIQLTYPVTICYPAHELIPEAAELQSKLLVSGTGQPDVPEPARGMTYNKLSSYRGVEFLAPLLCTTPYAPVVYVWLTIGEVKKIEEQKEVQALFLHETEGIEDLQDSMAIANTTSNQLWRAASRVPD